MGIGSLSKNNPLELSEVAKITISFSKESSWPDSLPPPPHQCTCYVSVLAHCPFSTPPSLGVLTSGGTSWCEACAANRRIFVTSGREKKVVRSQRTLLQLGLADSHIHHNSSTSRSESQSHVSLKLLGTTISPLPPSIRNSPRLHPSSSTGPS